MTAGRILLAVVVVLFWPTYMVAAAARSPFSWRERDWNDDGRTSWGEFVYGVEVGRMPVECPGTAPGTEYFILKDASTIKIDCARPWVGEHRPEW